MHISCARLKNIMAYSYFDLKREFTDRDNPNSLRSQMNQLPGCILGDNLSRLREKYFQEFNPMITSSNPSLMQLFWRNEVQEANPKGAIFANRFNQAEMKTLAGLANQILGSIALDATIVRGLAKTFMIPKHSGPTLEIRGPGIN
jgi:hypothetical protein